jgi:putative transposase
MLPTSQRNRCPHQTESGAHIQWNRLPTSTGIRNKRRPELGTGARRDLFLRVLERARQKYRFVVIGYVVMPEHFHLLITEPDVGDPSLVMKVIKERFTKLLHHGGIRTGPIWQKRFYDFNVCTSKKRIEKLR